MTNRFLVQYIPSREPIKSLLMSCTGILCNLFSLAGESSSHDVFLGSTVWLPYSNLKEYHNFQDIKIYALNVPVYVSEMELTFTYTGYYSGSHKPCNNTITV